ncbi:MAG TPA: AMP-binding protein, partial [Thermoanaerobaculia bacterium]
MTIPAEQDKRIPLLGELLAGKVARLGDRTALRYREAGEWREISWRRLGEDVRAAARALVDLGVDEGDRVAIWSANRPEWTIADLACQQIRAVSVPLYAAASESQAGYILREAEAKVTFVGASEQLAKANALLASVPSLAHLVVLDSSVQADGPVTVRFGDFLAAGRESGSDAEVERRLGRASLDDLLTLIYTSGTTGEPKGVMLTHGNFASTAAYHDERLPDPGESDVSLCFLPLAHVFERTWTTYALLNCGMTIAYCDEPAKVVEFLKEVRPTVMCAVPRFYEKVYGTVLDRVESASALRRALFHWAVGVGSERAKRL